MSVVKNLVSGIVDYAGLFPPASLPLDRTVENFARYLASEHAWMLARLVLPADRLREIECIDSFTASDKNWRISALVPTVDSTNDAFAQGIESIVEFNRRHSASQQPTAIVDSVEIRVSSVDDMLATINGMPSGMPVFLEIPHVQDPTVLLERIRHLGNHVFAKIRTGGVTLDLIPSRFDVARFICTCARLNVGFKATAGLHHPLHGRYPLTYEQNPEFGMLFGYLNVFVAACFAFSKNLTTEVVEAILVESDSAAFGFSEQTLTWRDLEISASEVSEIRATKAISFGSCSFAEPTTELDEMGWLHCIESANANQ